MSDFGNLTGGSDFGGLPGGSDSGVPIPVRDAEVEGARVGQGAGSLIDRAIKLEYLYGMLGLVLGLASIIGGVILCLNGVTGSTSWTAKLLGLESQINDAVPGVVLFIVGLFMIWVTKPKVRLKDVRDTQSIH